MYKVTLPHTPGMIKPKHIYSKGGIALPQLTNTPKDLPHGDILINPTEQAIFDALMIYHYYIMPEANRGRLRVIDKDEPLPLEAPKTTSPSDVNEWFHKTHEYLQSPDAILPDRRIQAEAGIMNHGTPHQAYVIKAGTDEEEPLEFHIVCMMQNIHTIHALMFTWQWRNPSFINKVYEDKIRALLHHPDCVDWSIGQTPHPDEPIDS